MLGARDNPRTFLNPAPIDFAYDFNRDARVNAVDMLIARDNPTSFLDALRLITVPGRVRSAHLASGARSAPYAMVADWVGELDDLTHGRRPLPERARAATAINVLLAIDRA